jgi:ElaB/YqjD/DUF883 family membrane-anchored ribosome-binding protein
MQKYSILTINGSSGPVIADIFNQLGLVSEYNNYRRLEDDESAVIISYQHGTFAWVMTSHFLDNILKSYNEGDTSIFDAWEEHWIGPDVITSPLEITPETWATHVIRSYEHIGKYAPLNGLYEEIEKVIENPNVVERYNIELEQLISDPESVLDQIGEITGKDITDIKGEFLANWTATKEKMKPWMDAIIAKNNGKTDLTINHFGTIIQITV